MSLSVRIWNQSSSFVELAPQWSMEEDIDKIYNLNRTPTGNATLYTYATWREWKIPLRLVPSSVAAWVNSLYTGERSCRLEVIENGVSQVYSVMIVNKESPFTQFAAPHYNYYNGELKLSEY